MQFSLATRRLRPFILGLAVNVPASLFALEPPADGPLQNGLPPEQALAAFTAYEGFRVATIAAEPDVRQPVAMTLDDRGRLWIAEAYTYPNRAEGDTGNDRILIFADENGDGSFETRKIFADDLNLVSGLEVGFGGVWVGAAPYLLFIPDHDGDDLPDGPPERMLDGWGYQDTHETLNSFIWGPDGWLYGCHGVFTHSRVGRPGTADADRLPINAGIWRFHPVEKTFEVFAQGTSNPWGIDFNDHGHAFVTACVIPHLYHIIQGGRYQRQAGQHFDPHTYSDIKTIADHLHFAGDNPWESTTDGSAAALGGGHAHCGLTIYLGDNFPPQFRNGLLFNNLHGHRINHDVIERSGSGYVGRHRPDFLISNDKQHMGIALRYGPDGGVFFIDWYDRQTCHQTLQEVWDRSNGRIYKITYGDPKPLQVNLRKLDDLALVQHHLHDNDWFVRTARRVLQERHAVGTPLNPAAVASLREMLDHPSDTRRLRALWTLHVTRNLPEDELFAVMNDDASEEVRAWAVQLAAESPPSPKVLGAMTQLATTDPSPQVHLYLSSALQRLPLEQRLPLATALLSQHAHDGDHNLSLMLWYGVSDLAASHPQQALELAIASKVQLVRRYLIRRLAGSPEGREALLAAVSKLADDRSFQIDLLSGMSQSVADTRNLPAPPSWQQAAEILEAVTVQDSRRDFERIATVFGDERMKDRFRELLANPSADKADRLAALENLRRLEDSELGSRLLQAVAAKGDPMRVDWLQALALVKEDAVARELVKLLPSLNHEEKQAAVLALTADENRALALSQALASGTVARAEISAFAARQLRSYDNENINSILAEHWGTIADGARDKSAETARYVAELTPEALAEADLRHGREIYRATCHACHPLFGDGNPLGPDLTGSNRGDLHYLLENILDPGAVVGIDYQLHILQMKDGRVLAGLMRSKTDQAITLGMAGGPDSTVQLEEIKEHQISAVSMMPEGLLDNLSKEETRDLIAYLQSPHQVPLPSPDELMIDDAAMTVEEVTRGEVKPQGMADFNGGSWSADSQLWWLGGQLEDRLVITFEVPTAKRYEVFGVFTKALDYATVSLSINGKPAVASLDLFHKPAVIPTSEIPLGTHALEAGSQKLGVEITGANPEAIQRFMFGIDHLRLVPVE